MSVPKFPLEAMGMEAGAEKKEPNYREMREAISERVSREELNQYYLRSARQGDLEACIAALKEIIDTYQRSVPIIKIEDFVAIFEKLPAHIKERLK